MPGKRLFQFGTWIIVAGAASALTVVLLTTSDLGGVVLAALIAARLVLGLLRWWLPVYYGRDLFPGFSPSSETTLAVEGA